MSCKRVTGMDGGGRSFKFVRGTTRSHAVTRGSRREGTMKYNLTTEDTEITEDTDRRWHSLREWSAQKNPTLFMRACSYSAFLPAPILTSQDLSRRSGNPRYEGARSAGVRSRLAGIGGQKTKRKQDRLRKVAFFESHIRATNAPARRISIFLIMLKNSLN